MDGVQVGGGWTAAAETSAIVGEDLIRAELIAFPLLFLVSLWVFRGLVAALLPPVMGALVIFGGFFFLGVSNQVFGVSVYALNLVTGLGLGLAIDYSLLIVSRYREEIARSGPGLDALTATLRSAGKSVIFSAITVGAALAGTQRACRCGGAVGRVVPAVQVCDAPTGGRGACEWGLYGAVGAAGARHPVHHHRLQGIASDLGGSPGGRDADR